MTTPTLHYVYDPLCGWCYAATPMIEAVERTGIKIVLRGGGLWDPASNLTAAKRVNIWENDARIAKLTGMSFGPAYSDTLLADTATIFWSQPTVAAVIAAGTVQEGSGLKMMHAIQRAHYVSGLRVVETAVLAGVAKSIGLSESDFLQALQCAPVSAHIETTRQWMQRLGLRGYPSFVLEHGGRLSRVEHEFFYGEPDAFVNAVNSMMVRPSSSRKPGSRRLAFG